MADKGWNWFAFLCGPFWYLKNGLLSKGLLLLVLVFATLCFGLPLICIYCAVKANADLYEKRLGVKSKYDLEDV